MAYKESETLKANTPYSLEEYSFNCIFDDSPTLGTYARASMTKDGQTVYKTVSLPNNSKILGWTVEANEDTADVYAVVSVPTGSGGKIIPSGFELGPLGSSFNYSNGGDYKWHPEREHGPKSDYEYVVNGGYSTAVRETATSKVRPNVMIVSASLTPFTITITEKNSSGEESSRTVNISDTTTYRNKTFYGTTTNLWVYAPEVEYESGLYNDVDTFSTYPASSVYVKDTDLSYLMLFGEDEPTEYEEKEMLIGRFAIEIEDAGGVGPGDGTGGGWADPEDYDEDWEEGDPTHTLYVEVTGALSGRHNDPIVDPSYSYIPADKDTVKDYGCGGDGGHGGGGGAGASTVVVHKFATNQANSKEVTAVARRHGYGSGGGKGGKGGDGCILVYY